jgi:hypothetical protein
MIQGYGQCLVTQQAAGTLFNTYTTAKTVINPQALYVLPAGALYIGKQWLIKVVGAISNIVTTPGTINFQIKMGSVVAFDTGAIQLNATAHTTLPFWLDILLTCRSVGNGTNAAFMGQGNITGKMVTATAGQTDSAQDMPTLMCPATAPANGTGFDSTVANIVDLWAGFSISNAGNGVQIQQYSILDLN